MSDDWRHFLCQLSEHRGSIMVDVGISPTIQGTPPTLAVLTLAYKFPAPNGLPTNEEFSAVRELSERFEAFVKLGGDHYVGHITRNGERMFFTYTQREQSSWESFRSQLS